MKNSSQAKNSPRSCAVPTRNQSHLVISFGVVLPAEFIEKEESIRRQSERQGLLGGTYSRGDALQAPQHRLRHWSPALGQRFEGHRQRPYVQEPRGQPIIGAGKRLLQSVGLDRANHRKRQLLQNQWLTTRLAIDANRARTPALKPRRPID